MARLVDSYDYEIKVISLDSTESLNIEDARQIYDSGLFRYTPPKIILSEQKGSTEIKEEEELSVKQRARNVSNEIGNMLEDVNVLLGIFNKRSKGITFQFDPEDLKNESLANAEDTLFGTMTGKITYAMYQKVLVLEDKIDKWLSHTAISNNGNLYGAR